MSAQEEQTPAIGERGKIESQCCGCQCIDCEQWCAEANNPEVAE